MTVAINAFPSSSPASMSASVQRAQATPIACRKRKDLEDGDDMFDDEGDMDVVQSHSTMKHLRQFTKRSDGDQQAQFMPLPADLNMQVLANLGYLQSLPNALPRDLGSFSRVSHSPTSSFSDFGGPSTPSDVAGSTESYFAKGMRRDSSAMYPTFDIYPLRPTSTPTHTPGLLGMHMNAPSVGSSDENGMQMDGMEEQPVHGSHCKSIPQLHVRSEPGVSSELWALCPDCGTRSKVDSPPVSDALSYSP